MSDTIPTTEPPTQGAPEPLNYSPPPAPTPFRRAWTATRRWMRDNSTREQVISGLKQLAWVAPMTVLIWVYAERQQQETGDVRFVLEAHSSNPKVAVDVTEPRDGYVSVSLRAPRRRLEDLRRGLGLRSTPVRFEFPADRKEGEHQFPVALAVEGDIRFEGVTFPRAEEVTVRVEPIDEEDIAVSIRDEDRSRIEQPVFSPAKVKVKMARSALSQARQPNGQLVAYADLSGLSDQTPGPKPGLSGIRVFVPNVDPENVTIEPSTVSASLVVREGDKTYRISEVTIQESVPTALRETIMVKMDRLVLFNVDVSGPQAMINEIEQTQGRGIEAFVSIDSTDRDQGPQKKQVWFRKPDGVKIDTPIEPIEVTVTTRRPSPQ